MSRITLDRQQSIPLQEQLIQALRYQMATGQWKPGTLVPSTRALGRQLGISFHTVRKAYQQLEQEGLLEAIPGKGYVVRAPVSRTRAERLELGAGVIQKALQELIGLGLNEEEIEYLVQEQLTELDLGATPQMGVLAESLELAELYARQLSHHLQQPFEPLTAERLEEAVGLDALVAPYPLLRDLLPATSGTDLLGFNLTLPVAVLEAIQRLLPDETLGLFTRDAETIPALMNLIQHQSGYRGPILATALTGDTPSLKHIMPQIRLLLYTPAVRRHLRVRPGHQEQLPVQPVITPDAMTHLSTHLPT